MLEARVDCVESDENLEQINLSKKKNRTNKITS